MGDEGSVGLSAFSFPLGNDELERALRVLPVPENED